MRKIVIATNNEHKFKEISPLISEHFELLKLSDINCFEDIPEDQDTIEGNASQKARYIFEKFGFDCFADDTGLEVETLDNEPGVYSARYAGPQRDSNDNIDLLLRKLEGKENRKARFKTIISLFLDSKEYLFEGIVNGRIIENKTGTEGFGYDPVFVPDGYNETFAQMKLEEKNKISHRARATMKLVEFLKKC